jgi:hypothetical protein
MAREPHEPDAAVLVHAIGRTPASMLLLAARLRRAGIKCHLFGYSATLESFERITRRLTKHLQSVARPYVAVGHSLGGILLRVAIHELPAAARPEHLFMLGSPNQSPRLARRLHRSWPYRLVHGDCGQLLADSRRMGALPPPRVPTTLVAGTRGWHGRWSPFAAEPNDGVVAVDEVAMNGVDMVRLPEWHTFLMNSRQVSELILKRLRA